MAAAAIALGVVNPVLEAEELAGWPDSRSVEARDPLLPVRAYALVELPKHMGMITRFSQTRAAGQPEDASAVAAGGAPTSGTTWGKSTPLHHLRRVQTLPRVSVNSMHGPKNLAVHKLRHDP